MDKLGSSGNLWRFWRYKWTDKEYLVSLPCHESAQIWCCQKHWAGGPGWCESLTPGPRSPAKLGLTQRKNVGTADVSSPDTLKKEPDVSIELGKTCPSACPLTTVKFQNLTKLPNLTQSFITMQKVNVGVTSISFWTPYICNVKEADCESN